MIVSIILQSTHFEARRFVFSPLEDTDYKISLS